MKVLFCPILLVCLILYSSAITCYYGYSGSLEMLPNPITITQCGNDTCVCTNYEYTCRSDDQSCTAQEQQTQVQKWAWTVVDNTTCQEILMLPTIYMNATCCYTDLCNNENLDIADTNSTTFTTNSTTSADQNIALSVKSSFHFPVVFIVFFLLLK